MFVVEVYNTTIPQSHVCSVVEVLQYLKTMSLVEGNCITPEYLKAMSIVEVGCNSLLYLEAMSVVEGSCTTLLRCM